MRLEAGLAQSHQIDNSSCQSILKDAGSGRGGHILMSLHLKGQQQRPGKTG